MSQRAPLYMTSQVLRLLPSPALLSTRKSERHPEFSCPEGRQYFPEAIAVYRYRVLALTLESPKILSFHYTLVRIRVLGCDLIRAWLPDPALSSFEVLCSELW